MGRAVSSGFIDGGLTAIAGSTTITVCAGQPTSISNIAARALATATITGGSLVIGAGTPNGRDLTVGQQNDLPITVSGTADHIAIDDGTDFYVTTATTQVLTSGGTVTVNNWVINIADPTA